MKFSPNYTLPALALLGLGLSSCQPDIDASPAASAGSADFTHYIAVGNSLTAGYSDGGLYNEAQATSYPAILAQQFGKTDKAPAGFTQPVFADAQKDGSGYVKLTTTYATAGGQSLAMSPAPTQPSPANQFLGEKLALTGTNLPGGPELAAYTGAQPENLGVPGVSVLSSVSALTGGQAPFGAINPFFERLLTAAERPTKDYVTYIGQKTNSTFFTCWLGNNDVLTYATNGGVTSPLNPFSGLTDTTRFGVGYRAILATVTRNSTVKGAVANIPDVTAIPYFKTVTVALVAANFKAVNAASPGVFISTAGGVRLATDADLLTLTAQTYIGTVAATTGTAPGSLPTSPLPSQYVLDATEIAAVKARTIDLNNIIAKTAAHYKLPLADMNAFFTQVAQGNTIADAQTNSTTFATGNLFSLDGVHPTPRGYALVANEWIRVINGYYGATVPTVALSNYRGVLFPQ